MILDRRSFLARSTGAVALGASLVKAVAAAQTDPAIKAFAFDAFPIFDPRAGFKIVRDQFPDRGDELRQLWFNKIFAYTWLRTSGERYKDFRGVMEDALRFAAASLGLELTADKQDAILDAFLQLPVWPDVPEVLSQLEEQGYRLAFLSNMTEEMLRANLRHNNLEDAFEQVLSTDRAQAFKPAPEAYQLGIDALGLQKHEIAFVAFAGWDAAGASWFGYPTVWVNRLGAPPEELDTSIDVAGSGLEALSNLLDHA